MILVTVGSTHFDDLIREVDRLIATGDITDEVFAQIGTGEYHPSNMQWAGYLDDIEAYFKKADLIIAHGGSTVFEILTMGKPLIAVANRSLQDDHQYHLLRVLTSRAWCPCCLNLSELEGHIKSLSHYKSLRAEPQLPGVIWSFVTDKEKKLPDQGG